MLRLFAFVCAFVVFSRSLPGQEARAVVDSSGGRISVPGVAALAVAPGQVQGPTEVSLRAVVPAQVPGLFRGETPVRSIQLGLRTLKPGRMQTIDIVGTGSLTLEGAPTGPEALVALVRLGEAPGPRGERLPEASGFLAATAAQGRLTAEVPLMTGLSTAETFTLVDLSQSREWKQKPELRETPEDPAPLGGRHPVILIHGIESRENPEGDVEQGGKVKTWDKLRASPRYAALRQRCKFYIYLYPTYRSVAQNGTDLVQLVEEKIGLAHLPSSSVLIVAHSMGGLVSRHAMRTAGFGEKVRTLVTLATPHHGTPASSILYANWGLHKKIGWFWTLLLKGSRAVGYPDTPGLRSLWWDNLDGGIPQLDQREYAVAVSAETAHFNQTEPNSAKLVCLMGDIRSLAGHGALGSAEIVRQGIERYEARYKDVDPQVPKMSGTFAGALVHASKTYPDVDHNQIPADATVLADLFDVVTASVAR
ncbi:MAG: hypothetical protein HY303_16650 [Candidatus Wallbacteria bacterium]|nr:hypothetical protein [Candidatus Wallbacteria bacterium]